MVIERVKLKRLLGIDGDEKAEVLDFVMEKTRDWICNYCGLKTVPEGLMTTFYEIAVELYRAMELGQEQPEGVVKSITEGSVSVTMERAGQNDFFKNYAEQLNRYRRVGW